MSMGVDETRRCGVAMEIDHTRIEGDESLDFSVRSNLENDAMADGNSLCDGVVGVNGENAAANHYDVRRFSRWSLRIRRQSLKGKKSDQQTRRMSHSEKHGSSLGAKGTK